MNFTFLMIFYNRYKSNEHIKVWFSNKKYHATIQTGTAKNVDSIFLMEQLVLIIV